MKQAINTRTQEEYDALRKYYQSLNIPWRGGQKAIEYDAWLVYGEDCCVALNTEGELCISQSGKSFYEQKGYTVIPYTEFAANIVEEPDYKALYLEARELLWDCLSIDAAYEKDANLLQEVNAFLTKHNTPNRDGE